MWLVGWLATAIAVFVVYGSHLLVDITTLGGVQFFWPSRAIAVFPGRDEYRVVSGSNSERVFVAFALVFALLFYPVSRIGFGGLIYRMGGADRLYGRITSVSYGDNIDSETQGFIIPMRLIGVDTPETVASDKPVGRYGPEASEYMQEVLYEPQIGVEGEILSEVRREIPRIGGSEDAYGRTLAYICLDTNGGGRYEHSFNEDQIELGLARTTDFSHEHRREFERLRKDAEERGRRCGAPAPRWKATEESVAVRPRVAGQRPLRLVTGHLHGFFTARGYADI